MAKGSPKKTKALVVKTFKLGAGEKLGPRYKKKVPCSLGEEDRKVKSDRVLEAMGERKREREAMSLATSGHRKTLNELEREMETLRAQVAVGIEEREVYVAERKNYRDDVVEIYRLDTNEMVESRPLTPQERQDEFPVVGRARRGGKKGAVPAEAEPEGGGASEAGDTLARDLLALVPRGDE